MKLLVIDAWLVTPEKDGGSLRMSKLLALIQSLGHEITFAADDFASRASAVDAMRAAGIRILAPPEVDSIAEYLSAHGGEYEIVILSRVPQATKYMAAVREFAPQARVIFDTTDLHYLRVFRAAKASGNTNLLRQALELRRQELAAVRAADVTLVVSTIEQEILAQDCPEARVRVISNIHAVRPPARPFGEREGILFVGAFPHHPNGDAMRYFFDDIYPHLKTSLERVSIRIIGSQPPDWLKAFASETVHITGHVPDVVPYLERCRLSIAPLRFGAGVKGKVLESMGYGVPVVLTTVAAEGIPCRDHYDCLIADEPVAFAEAIRELYHGENLWNTLSANGMELVDKHFSEEVARTGLLQVFQVLQVVAVSE